MKTYSQYGEDLKVAECFDPGFVGSVLDIGAWAATTFSNSRAFIEQGWRAMLVEPSPEPFLGLLREYGKHERVELLNAAIGFERSFAKMHATADAVSTTDDGVYQKWKQAGGYYGSFWTPTFTLTDIFNQFGGDWDFVSIDTEGSSVDVFAAWMQTGNRPKVFCVEHDDRIVEINQIAAAAGYRQHHLNGTNVILVLA